MRDRRMFWGITCPYCSTWIPLAQEQEEGEVAPKLAGLVDCGRCGRGLAIALLPLTLGWPTENHRGEG